MIRFNTLTPKQQREVMITEYRSKKGPGDHREIASDTAHAHASGRPEHIGTGRRCQHKAEHDQQGFFQGRKMK